jgi:hypothetical protein
VREIEAHGLLGLDRRVSHLTSPICVRRIKLSKPTLGFRLLDATSLNERGERVGVLEPASSSFFDRGWELEAAPNLQAPIAFERPVQDTGQLVGHDPVKQVRVLVDVGESAVKRNGHQPAQHPVGEVGQAGDVVAQQDRHGVDKREPRPRDSGAECRRLYALGELKGLELSQLMLSWREHYERAQEPGFSYCLRA